jgi:hypothetical protein
MKKSVALNSIAIELPLAIVAFVVTGRKSFVINRITRMRCQV